MNYRDFMLEHARKFPNVPMYAYNDSKTGERVEIFPEKFSEQVFDLSAYLLSKGYEHKHIGILSPNSYDYILVRQAILCCGCVVVFLDVRLEMEELIYRVEDSESGVIFFSKESEQQAKELSKKCSVPLLDMSLLAEYMEAGKKLREEGKFKAEDVDIDPDALAFLLYTSGTTGRSKGVMLSHNNYMTVTRLDYERGKGTWGDTVLLIPLTHVFSETPHIIALRSGHTLFINTNMRKMFDDIRSERPHVLIVVPLFVQTFMDYLLKSIRDAGKEDKVRQKLKENRSLTLEQKREIFREELEIFGGRLYKIVTAGAPISQKLINEFHDFGIDIVCGYGCTECSGCVTIGLYGHTRAGSVGIPLDETEVKIINGEICVKGPHVMLGYYHKQAETEEALRDGWFHTGDCGYLDEDNFLYVTGRLKNLIILSNGENVSPEELEGKIAAAHPDIKEVLVYSEGEDIVAEIYPEIENAKKYVSELNETLANYKRINIVKTRKEPFERTSSGKIKRK